MKLRDKLSLELYQEKIIILISQLPKTKFWRRDKLHLMCSVQFCHALKFLRTQKELLSQNGLWELTALFEEDVCCLLTDAENEIYLLNK
jgi:hypothetical protein